MKTNKAIGVTLLFLLAALTVAPIAWAQSMGYGTNITDLMGEQPGNAYYQNSGSGAQAQGSNSTTGSAAASVLQQEATGSLRVDAPAITILPAQTQEKSSAWKWFAVLAMVFLIAAATLFVLGRRDKKRKAHKLETIEELPVVKEIIAQAGMPIYKKPAKKKKNNRSKVRRGKKRK